MDFPHAGIVQDLLDLSLSARQLGGIRRRDTHGGSPDHAPGGQEWSDRVPGGGLVARDFPERLLGRFEVRCIEMRCGNLVSPVSPNQRG